MRRRCWRLVHFCRSSAPSPVRPASRSKRPTSPCPPAFSPNSPSFLTDEQKVPNTLGELGKKCLLPETNIIKLPNISASVAQLKACVKELQEKGYAIPDYPETTNTDEEKALKARFGKCIGSAVNPVLREGNSDRRAPGAVKNYAKKRPHSMGEWKQWSQTHVSHMEHGDFYHGEKSLTLDKPREVRMELIAKGGKTTVLKPKLSLLEGEIIDSMFMSKKALVRLLRSPARRLPRSPASSSRCTSRLR